MTVRGIRVMFHSALSFIRILTSILLICTASVTWRSMASFLYDPVTDIRNVCISPACCSTQCRHRGELFKSLAVSLAMCSPPLVYALYADSPLYTFFSQFLLPQSILYVILSVLQLPCPNVVQTRQSPLPQLGSLNGFEVVKRLKYL